MPNVAEVEGTKIIFNNIRNLKTAHQYAAKDDDLQGAHVVILVESHVCSAEADNYALPNFDHAYHTEDGDVTKFVLM